MFSVLSKKVLSGQKYFCWENGYVLMIGIQKIRIEPQKVSGFDNILAFTPSRSRYIEKTTQEQGGSPRYFAFLPMSDTALRQFFSCKC